LATPLLYLPGAGGSAGFWRPVAETIGGRFELLSWPGLGQEPADPNINSIDDLVSLTLSRIDGPVDLVAQSMGGYVAVKVALAAPARIRRLVLAVTSAGVPMAALGSADWRSDYVRNFPAAAGWIASPTLDLSAQIGAIKAPTLLLWGDADPISPVAVGQRLDSLLPHSSLHVIPGGGHDLALTHSGSVAALIAAHLQ
jgi:pimeloyl-ACP methyl ester carboxylesterase